MSAQAFCEIENTDPAQHKRWLDKHGFVPDENGKFPVNEFEGKVAVESEKLFENIRKNVSAGGYRALFTQPYDERVFVMVCGGPSLAEHLDEILAKAEKPDEYLVVCSNMTASYLLEHGIKPHVHFILDPQEKKRFDVAPGKTSKDIDYWINVACDPAVFAELKAQDIIPHVFLADFESTGKAMLAVKESLPPGLPGMMAIQGGTMAGLRALNLADALGFRRVEYYGFDATVRVTGGRAAPYAYEKKRGEAVIEVECDLCQEKFNTTLIFQRQVNEFLSWHYNMPWLDISIIGGGLISHTFGHARKKTSQKAHATHRFTEGYRVLQQSLHGEGDYGVTGRLHTSPIYLAISQLAKKHGAVTVLDYGSSDGGAMRHVEKNFWLPPDVTYRCYDPFVDQFAAEPEPADFLICTDVLEHVEPECTKAVLDHLVSLTKKFAYFSISLVPANKSLADGRNAHINLPGSEFWLKELKKRFVIGEAKECHNGQELLVVAQSIEGVQQTMREQRESARTAS